MTIEEYNELPECEDKEEYRKVLIQDFNNQIEMLTTGADFKVIGTDPCVGVVTEIKNGKERRLDMLYRNFHIVYDLRKLKDS